MRLLRLIARACWESLVDIAWFFWAILGSFAIGRIGPHRGVKVLVYTKETEASDKPARIRRGRLSLFNYPERTLNIRFRLKKARWRDDDRYRIREAAWNERGLTWCFGWKGEAADALRAAVTMQ